MAVKKFLKVYLNRGFIGLPQAVRESAKCLGLTRRYQTVFVRPLPLYVGHLLRIKELVRVSLVDACDARPANRASPPGFSIVRSEHIGPRL